MLRLRVITACVLAALLVLSVVLLSLSWLALLVGVLMLLAGWEWSRLAGMSGPASRGLYLAVLAGVLAGIWWYGFDRVAQLLLPVVLAFWVGFTAWLLAGGRPRTGLSGARPRWLLAGVVLLPALFVSVLLLAELPSGRALLLYSFFLVFAVDTGAYFSGRRFGRHRLAPAVSSGKTWEGLVGGLLGAVAFSALVGLLLGITGDLWGYWIGIGLLAAGLSVSGDLFESVLKREAGVKDSGALLPGHGGLLDRADSIVAALPVQGLGLGWLFGVIAL